VSASFPDLDRGVKRDSPALGAGLLLHRGWTRVGVDAMVRFFGWRHSPGSTQAGGTSAASTQPTPFYGLNESGSIVLKAVPLFGLQVYSTLPWLASTDADDATVQTRITESRIRDGGTRSGATLLPRDRCGCQVRNGLFHC
jgi:hypothetical protein